MKKLKDTIHPPLVSLCACNLTIIRQVSDHPVLCWHRFS